MIGKLCILKGGIDALKLEHEDLLKKSSKNISQKDFITQYERFVKKIKIL